MPCAEVRHTATTCTKFGERAFSYAAPAQPRGTRSLPLITETLTFKKIAQILSFLAKLLTLFNCSLLDASVLIVIGALQIFSDEDDDDNDDEYSVSFPIIPDFRAGGLIYATAAIVCRVVSITDSVLVDLGIHQFSSIGRRRET